MKKTTRVVSLNLGKRNFVYWAKTQRKFKRLPLSTNRPNYIIRSFTTKSALSIDSRNGLKPDNINDIYREIGNDKQKLHEYFKEKERSTYDEYTNKARDYTEYSEDWYKVLKEGRDEAEVVRLQKEQLLGDSNESNHPDIVEAGPSRSNANSDWNNTPQTPKPDYTETARILSMIPGMSTNLSCVEEIPGLGPWDLNGPKKNLNPESDTNDPPYYTNNETSPVTSSNKTMDPYLPHGSSTQSQTKEISEGLPGDSKVNSLKRKLEGGDETEQGNLSQKKTHIQEIECETPEANEFKSDSNDMETESNIPNSPRSDNPMDMGGENSDNQSKNNNDAMDVDEDKTKSDYQDSSDVVQTEFLPEPWDPD